MQQQPMLDPAMPCDHCGAPYAAVSMTDLGFADGPQTVCPPCADVSDAPVLSGPESDGTFVDTTPPRIEVRLTRTAHGYVSPCGKVLSPHAFVVERHITRCHRAACMEVGQ